MISPAPPGSQFGNRISAERWAAILRQLGHKVALTMSYDGAPCDLLVALHAKRSAPAVFEFRRQHPSLPVIVALTGTDLYRDIHRDRKAQKAVEAATRLVALQSLAPAKLPSHLRDKVRVIYQSVERTRGRTRPPHGVFQVCVVGHLRGVKDPFRTAMAARALPANSRIRIVQAGAAMGQTMAQRAHAEERRNPRFRWLGEIPRRRARRLIASSHLMVLSSRMEGGANVISEAVVDGTPVLASRIPGSIGLLGADYAGYFPVGDTAALLRLLVRAETQRDFYERLRAQCRKRVPLFRVNREREDWRTLLAEILIE